MSNMTVITNDQGVFPSHAYDHEPEPGSVVLTNGEFGTAWQRYFSDGLWHRVGGGRPITWDQLIRNRNTVLVYAAAVREEMNAR